MEGGAQSSHVLQTRDKAIYARITYTLLFAWAASQLQLYKDGLDTLCCVTAWPASCTFSHSSAYVNHYTSTGTLGTHV